MRGLRGRALGDPNGPPAGRGGHGTLSIWEGEFHCCPTVGEHSPRRCPQPPPGGNMLFLLSQEDVFIQQTQDTKNPVIYAVFSASG